MSLIADFLGRPLPPHGLGSVHDLAAAMPPPPPCKVFQQSSPPPPLNICCDLAKGGQPM